MTRLCNKINSSNNIGFEKKDDLLFESDVDKKIREFAGWCKDRLPEHIASFSVTITRDGYLTNNISMTKEE